MVSTRHASTAAKRWSSLLGVDTFAGDPISHFCPTTDDYPTIGARLAGLDVPTVLVMEGGYAVDALGRNVAGVLDGVA